MHQTVRYSILGVLYPNGVFVKRGLLMVSVYRCSSQAALLFSPFQIVVYKNYLVTDLTAHPSSVRNQKSVLDVQRKDFWYAIILKKSKNMKYCLLILFMMIRKSKKQPEYAERQYFHQSAAAPLYYFRPQASARSFGIQLVLSSILIRV